MQITLKNRLAELLRKRKIRSAREFGRRMTAAGYTMSSSHATRFEKDDPPATDLRFLAAACNVLQCLPSDLYEITVTIAPGETIDPVSLVLPPHAVVVKDGAVQAQMLPVSEPLQADAGHAAAAPPAWGAKSRASPPPVPTKKSTGPSGAIYPYKKR